MARGNTFGQIYLNTILECKLDPNPGLSINIKPLVQQLIKREYERLYDEFDWPFSRIRVDIPMQAGERYYDFPANMDLERIEDIEVSYGGRWLPVERGISGSDFNTYNSDLGVGVDPVRKWDVAYVSTTSQIEAWPIPASGATSLRLTGIKKRNLLVDDSDTCDLDDTMIELFAASEYLASKGSPEAPVKQQKAVERYRMMKGRVIQTKNSSFNFSGGAAHPSSDRVPLVAYVRNP